jgi:hypothetical protein
MMMCSIEPDLEGEILWIENDLKRYSSIDADLQFMRTVPENALCQERPGKSPAEKDPETFCLLLQCAVNDTRHVLEFDRDHAKSIAAKSCVLYVYAFQEVEMRSKFLSNSTEMMARNIHRLPRQVHQPV